MTPPKSDRLVTRGTSVRSSACDIYNPPSPRPLVRAHTGPSSAMPLGLVRHRESFQNPPVKLRLAARGSGGAGALTPPASPGCPRARSAWQGGPPPAPKESPLPRRGVASLSAQPDSPRFAGVENNGFKLCREELVPAL